MRLTSMTYSQWEGTPREWKIEGVQLGPVNLLVGSNASGKTRTLNVISGLAKLLSGATKVSLLSGDYDVTFSNESAELHYKLKISDSKVTHESFAVGDTNYLERGAGGAGKIWAQKLNNFIDFQVPENELAAVSRRDSIQHPYFEPLNQWGESLYHYYFGTPLGKDHFAIIDSRTKREINPRDPNQVIGIFRQGVKEFGEPFIESIKRDMGAVNYLIDDIGVREPVSIVIHEPQGIVVLYVKETGLGDITDQVDMSQGMFRALSMIIQLNYSEMCKKPSCILIDDIGEGLDFDRSCALIKLLMGKAEAESVQLVMSTNDRFVMNTVPLEAWTVLRRVGTKIKVHNYANSRERFDQFKFTGMNNFDFFAFNFLDESKKD